MTLFGMGIGILMAAACLEIFYICYLLGLEALRMIKEGL
jgi:hypothetical protein